jgi:pyrroline-5-carboxylate reductase
MRLESVGFIGGGRVTRILVGGWQRTGRLPAKILVCDPDPEALKRLEQSFGPAVTAVAEPSPVSQQDLVVLAVHPPALAAALETARPGLRPGAVVLSLAPKVTMARMGQALDGFTRLARMIPNAPSVVGAGYNPVAFGPGLGEEERRQVLDLFEPLGECPQVVEEELEAYAVVSAMGPTYLWFQLATLRDLGVDFGLSQEAATRATARMVLGSATALFDGGLAETEVMDLIPVRPLARHETAVTEAYRSVLPALYEKLAASTSKEGPRLRPLDVETPGAPGFA